MRLSATLATIWSFGPLKIRLVEARRFRPRNCVQDEWTSAVDRRREVRTSRPNVHPEGKPNPSFGGGIPKRDLADAGCDAANRLTPDPFDDTNASIEGWFAPTRKGIASELKNSRSLFATIGTCAPSNCPIGVTSRIQHVNTALLTDHFSVN